MMEAHTVIDGMSQSQSKTRTEELSNIFVSVTGDEEVTETQDDDGNDRELRGESHIDEAVADGLEDALEGAEADTGDPGG
jgi:hypothetical protein